MTSAWTQSLYTYTGNDPVNFIDPTGYFTYYIGFGSQFGDSLFGYDSFVPYDPDQNPYMVERKTKKKFVETVVEEYLWAQKKDELELIEHYKAYDPWCGFFTIYNAWKAGLCDQQGNSYFGTLGFKTSAYKYYRDYIENGKCNMSVDKNDSHRPQTGDIMYYLDRDYKGNTKGWSGHCTIVMEIEEIEGVEYLITIEGNKNNGVRLVKRQLDLIAGKVYYVNMGAGMGESVPEQSNGIKRITDKPTN